MSLSEICSKLTSKKTTGGELIDKDIMEFITAPWGLGLGTTVGVPALYPSQRFIVKYYYGLEPDKSDNRDIIINDRFNENELYRFNEWEYMEYLYNEGRLNRKFEGKYKPNMVLACGRRSGKTTITACIIAYELYRLLNKYCPQEYYGIMPEDNIYITSVSNSMNTAKELYDKVTGNIERSEFFRKFRGKPTRQWMYFRTQRDLDKYGDKGRSSVGIRVAPCNAKGLRGPGNIIVAFDEMAFFFMDEKMGTRKNTGADRNDAEIYKAITPSVAKFKKKNGNPDGKVICISSPGGKTGKFFEEYSRAFNSDNEDLFVMRAPSWELDPGLSTQYLKTEYKKNPITFRSEFGAEFSDRLFGWIDEPKIVRDNVVPGLKYKMKGMEKTYYFMGIDVGLKVDGTAITIGHWATDMKDGIRVQKLEVDVSDVRYTDGTKENHFTPEILVDWIIDFVNKFPITKGLMDQYYGMSMIPLLKNKGFRQFEARDFNETMNSNLYQNLLALMISTELRLPEGDVVDIDKPQIKDSELVQEILTLQAEQKSKYIIKVSAPERKGMHDDLSDSFARMALLAVEHRNKGFSSGLIVPSTATHIQAARIMRHSEMIKASLNRPSSRYTNMMGNRFGGSSRLSRSFR